MDSPPRDDDQQSQDNLKRCIQVDIRDALKTKQTTRLETLRFLWARIQRYELDHNCKLDDQQTIDILKKVIKEHDDSIAYAKKGNRQDIVDQEQAELVILQSYLPEALDDETVDRIIQNVIAETGAQSLREMGTVLKVIKEKTQERVDMGIVSAKVKAILSATS